MGICVRNEDCSMCKASWSFKLSAVPKEAKDGGIVDGLWRVRIKLSVMVISGVKRH